MTAQGKAALMRKLRERRAREGLVQVNVWVKREQVVKLRRYVARLNKGNGDE